MLRLETPGMSRRQALLSVGGAAASVVTLRGDELPSFRSPVKEESVSFFFVTDTHYLANQEQPESMDPASAKVCRRLVETLNGLQGKVIPRHAGSGSVERVAGVIHGGDLVDSADKRGGVYPQMHATEFAAFESDYGLNGDDGVLHYPVHEVYGNHDGPHGDTLVIEGIRRRNQERKGLARVSPNGLHYSWDWGPVHFINLGIVVGQSGAGLQRRRYAPMGSLQFLRDDLRQLHDRDQPVVITQHIDLARYSVPYVADEEKFLHSEWHPQDVKAFHETVKPHHVIANFFGHTHRREVFGWNGTSQRQGFSESDVDAFNGDNSSHFRGGKQACFYVEIAKDDFIVREVFTEDGWKSLQWADRVWAKKI